MSPPITSGTVRKSQPPLIKMHNRTPIVALGTKSPVPIQIIIKLNIPKVAILSLL